MVGGALFAGNYFGGEVATAAETLFHIPNWSVSIQSSDKVDLFMISAESGVMSAATKMFNEYVIVAALAKRQEDVSVTTKVHDWWDRFIGNDGPPSGMETHNYPKTPTYDGHQTLGAGKNWFVSTFVMHFGWYLVRGMHTNPFYPQMFQSWLMGESYKTLVG